MKVFSQRRGCGQGELCLDHNQQENKQNSRLQGINSENRS